MFSCLCCSKCCLIFSVIAIIFLCIFGAMIRLKNVSFEEVWEANYVNIDEVRNEKSLACFIAAAIYAGFAGISLIGIFVSRAMGRK